MANDVLFRTSAFGGFKKDDVMSFIENVLSEKSNLERALATMNAEKTQLVSQLAQLQNELDDLSKLRSENASLNAEIVNLESSLSDKDDLITELTQRVSKAEANEGAQDEIDALKAENLRLVAELDKKRDLERQVGVAMLDARAHSEELVEAARERANDVTKSVYEAIGETAVKIDDLSAGIGEIARNFTKSVEEVELRIKVLTGDMSKTAQALISDTGYTEKILPTTVVSSETAVIEESDLGDDEY